MNARANPAAPGAAQPVVLPTAGAAAKWPGSELRLQSRPR